MVTSFSLFTPMKVQKILASSSGKVKKIEAQTKKWLSYKKQGVHTFSKKPSSRPSSKSSLFSGLQLLNCSTKSSLEVP